MRSGGAACQRGTRKVNKASSLICRVLFSTQFGLIPTRCVCEMTFMMSVCFMGHVVPICHHMLL